MKVLVAEDDQFTRDGIAEVLKDEGYEVEVAANGKMAIEKFNSFQPDFVCLDIMMPGASGYEVCKAIRAEDMELPIVFISAKSEEIDKLVGFELGADDFITKPFSVREVIARIRAVTRRCYAQKGQAQPETFVMNELEISRGELRARRGNQVVELSLRDVNLLQLLWENQGKALDRRTIYREAYGEPYFSASRTLDQHVSQLRKRIEIDPQKPAIVSTVHGVGYRFDSSKP
ncbi:MAG: response regulator transcription factor [Planctomycetota bacterium]|jgi:DNA-binding response OmpR family regulator|nr:response regulator transcription factor [Planctomycetota bacterium]